MIYRIYFFINFLTVIFFSNFTINTVYAASFSCDKANSLTEKLICNNNLLNKLDEELSSSYRSLMRDSSADEQALIKKDQRSWLKKRNGICDLEIVIKCENTYKDRILEIELKGTDANEAKFISTIFNILKNAENNYSTDEHHNKYRNITVLPRIGLRGLFINFGLDIKDIEKISGIKVFLEGPHKNKFDFNSDMAGKYNPEFLKWLGKKLEKTIYNNSYLYFLTKYLYHNITEIRNSFRTYYMVYNDLNKIHESDFVETNRKFFEYYESKGELNFYSFYEIPTAYNFWHRRIKGGTDKLLFKILDDWLQIFDKNFHMNNVKINNLANNFKSSEIILTNNRKSDENFNPLRNVGAEGMDNCLKTKEDKPSSWALCNFAYENKDNDYKIFEVCIYNPNKDNDAKIFYEYEGVYLLSSEILKHYKFDEKLADKICMNRINHVEDYEVDYKLFLDDKGSLTKVIYSVIINLGGVEYTLKPDGDMLKIVSENEIDLG